MSSIMPNLSSASESENNSKNNDEKNMKSKETIKKEKRGIIYLSTIPKFMNVTKVREIFGEYGEVDRVFLQPEEKRGDKSKLKKKKKPAKHFTEGWIEFKKKRVAKQVAALLNNKQIGGRKRSKYYDFIWNIKYLPRFKWVHLSERLAYERAVYKQRMNTEIAQAKREAAIFSNNVDLSERLSKRKDKETDQQTELRISEESDKIVHNYKQRELDSEIIEKKLKQLNNASMQIKKKKKVAHKKETGQLSEESRQDFLKSLFGKRKRFATRKILSPIKTPRKKPSPDLLRHGARAADPEVQAEEVHLDEGATTTTLPAAAARAWRAFVLVWKVLGAVLATLALLAWRLCRLLPRRRAVILHDVVLVTNAGRGIGRRLAVRFGLEAGLVVCWDPDIDRCMNTAWKRGARVQGSRQSYMVEFPDPTRQVYEVRHRGGAALGYAVDAADEAAVVAAAAVLRREVGQVHIVVLNVGRLPLRPLLRFTVKELHDLFQDNVFAHFVVSCTACAATRLAFASPLLYRSLFKSDANFESTLKSGFHLQLLKVFVPPMVLHNKGRVVFISSASSILPSAVEGAYVSTKQAVSGMIRGLREELAAVPRNRVSISCVYPSLAPRRNQQGAPDLQCGRQTLDEIARQIVTDLLLGYDTISVPHCAVFWMRLLRFGWLPGGPQAATSSR
ncbi:Pre-rRNA-processing protein esf2 [Frankliniella fusca]|uniref:Activator of basal transcription 1 n=1 Tax=Frankliniella fusca TaxID=407009 RepID=A0AAE1HQH8_9NEOP|nr:Pre-rRNA-processing protein esf2 [Frankliniella fusca]